jgi:hypothetical protein
MNGENKEIPLNHWIELLRKHLIELAAEKGSFIDEQVVLLSQQLDMLLNQSQANKHDTVILLDKSPVAV